ncbi:WD40 repeat-like protein, partial [Ascodesmis nigricans]
MAEGHFTTLHGPPPNPPPPPQPVPPPAPVPRKNVIARLAHPFISRPPSSNGAGTPNHYPSTNSAPAPPLATVRTGPRNITYEAGISIFALSAHADGDKVVLAGREHLRILKILDDHEPEELAVLRLPGEQKKQVLQHDVKWGVYGKAKNYIATAATNGNICLYDVNTGRVERTLREHQRQVHRLDWNPAGEILLSASHDGTIKLWDTRERRSRTTFVCKAEAVRDIQWNRTDALVFAAAFDSGIIQRWDYRNPAIYQKKINAHNGPVYSLDWHPDGKHLATGGRDRVVKVWDFQQDVDPRNKPKHTIWTASSVGKTLWRPVTSSANRANQTTEIATCALATDYSYRTDNRILVWDLKRPYLPARKAEAHEGTPTGMLWRDEDLLWSCSKDTLFMQHDIPYAVEPVKRLTMNTFDWSPESELTFAILKRSKNRRNGGSKVTFDTEDDLVRDDRRRHSHSGSFKPTKTSMKPDSPLDSPLSIYRPNQVTAKLEIPQLFDKAAFRYLATHYIIDLDGECGGRKYTLSQALELNARYAWKAQQYRTAQSWKMLRLGVEALQREEKKLGATTSQGLVARRALGLSGTDVIQSGGVTPVACPSPPTTLSQKQQQPVEENVNLPPAQFGHGPSSSTASTDGDE